MSVRYIVGHSVLMIAFLLKPFWIFLPVFLVGVLLINAGLRKIICEEIEEARASALLKGEKRYKNSAKF
jgi:hypothetical protein